MLTNQKYTPRQFHAHRGLTYKSATARRARRIGSRQRIPFFPAAESLGLFVVEEAGGNFFGAAVVVELGEATRATIVGGYSRR